MAFGVFQSKKNVFLRNYKNSPVFKIKTVLHEQVRHGLVGWKYDGVNTKYVKRKRIQFKR